MDDEDLIPIDYITDTGEPFQAEDLDAIFDQYPRYRIRVSALADKVSALYGSAEGDVVRITVVPAREEIVLYADFGNWSDG